MKNKKLFLPVLILAISVLAVALFSFASSIAKRPVITEGEFPFSITYELDGKIETINDVYRTYYDRNAGYADTKSRVYVGEIGDMGEDNTWLTLKKEADGRIELHTGFYADYMMGDTEYDYFDDEPFEPRLYYYDSQEQEYHDEETLAAHGVKLISFEYPTPIENSFVFSHLSYFSGAVVLPALAIALLGLIAMMIFVKKEADLQRKVVDIISIVLNFVIGLIGLPIVTFLAVLIDIEGGGPELYYQVMYFIPTISMLCIAASVGLRRKGYAVSSLIVCLGGPLAFALYLTVFAVAGVL